jgi:tetratricopeptide (TPR) repeat protein
VANIGGLLTTFYIFIGIVLLASAWMFVDNVPARGVSSHALGVIATPLFMVLIMVLVYVTNLRIIYADIAFKMAEPFTKNGQWQMATLLYKRALELAPMEDHYYLFLGRSYLEQAKAAQGSEEQDTLIHQAEADLQVAQRINPLNTDHTANLARLYSWWSMRAADSTQRMERGQTAANYYRTAVTLSPNNATIWGEWAILYLQGLRQPQDAVNTLNRAIEIDPEYSFTQGLMGEYYSTIAQSTDDVTDKELALQEAAFYYSEAVRVFNQRDTTSLATYLVYLGNTYSELARLNANNGNTTYIQQAITALEQAIDSDLRDSDLWKVQEALARLYAQIGDKITALAYANAALAGVAEGSLENIQTLIASIQAMP